MITEPGRVTRVAGTHVWVTSDSQQDCERCAQGVGCGGALMNRILRKRLLEVRAIAVEPLSVNECVDLHLSEQTLLKAAVLTYLLPLTGLIFGAVIGFLVSKTDPGTFLGASVGFVITLLVLRWLNARVFLNPSYQPMARRRFPLLHE